MSDSLGSSQHARVHTFRGNRRPSSALPTRSSAPDSSAYCRRLEARNKVLKLQLAGQSSEKAYLLQQLKSMIAQEEEALMRKEKEIKFYEGKIERLKNELRHLSTNEPTEDR